MSFVLFIALALNTPAKAEPVNYTMAKPTCGDSPNQATVYHGNYIEDMFTPNSGYHAFEVDFIILTDEGSEVCDYLVRSDWQEGTFIRDYMPSGLEDFEYELNIVGGAEILSMYIPLSLYNDWQHGYNLTDPEIFVDGIFVDVWTEPASEKDTADTGTDTANPDTGSKTAGGGVSCRGCQGTLGLPLWGLVGLLLRKRRE